MAYQSFVRHGLAAALLALVSCGDAQADDIDVDMPSGTVGIGGTDGAPNENALTTQRWFVVEVDDASWNDPVVPSVEFHHGADLVGFDGCNSYGAPNWDLIESTLSVPQTVGTHLECTTRPWWPSVHDGDHLEMPVGESDELDVTHADHTIHLVGEASLEDPSTQAHFEASSGSVSIDLASRRVQIGTCTFPVVVSPRTLRLSDGPAAMDGCVDRTQFQRGDSELVALLATGEALSIGVSPKGWLITSSAQGSVQIPPG